MSLQETSLASRLAKQIRSSTPVNEESSLPNELLQATSAWAVGLWRVQGDHLEQVLFAADPRFPADVAREFVATTRQVSLDLTALGIVNAVVHGRPALAEAAVPTGELRQSAGWLARFQANCSLSCPIHTPGGNIPAVLAVSWQHRVDIDDPTGQTLLNLAAQIGRELGD